MRQPGRAGIFARSFFTPAYQMKLTCSSCDRGRVFFSGICTLCGARNRHNTAAMDPFWGPGNGGRASSKDSFFRSIWAIPFKLLRLPVRLARRLARLPF